MEILSQNEWLRRISQRPLEARASYRAMYSTWWEGVVTDPHLMMIPIDDHQVHRGDAVFEAMKAVNGKIYLVKEHMDRLERSGDAIFLKSPIERNEMNRILKATLMASGLSDAILRVFLGRGPGSFSTNPYESIGSQFHVIVTESKEFPAERIEKGVSLGLSKVPVKDPWLAQIKSCNYLSNVLMKKEAVDQELDFTVGLDSEGCFTEGSTENLLILNSDGVLMRPRKERILAGTTMIRAFELAKQIPEITGLEEKSFCLEDLKKAREVFMAGTTLDVISVTKFEGAPIHTGKVGPVGKKLRSMIIEDQKNGTKSL